jgi:TusA-related sulfurtransferase
VIRLGEKARAAGPGAVLVLLADDPQAEDDVRLWCAGAGHEFLSVHAEATFTRIKVQLGS